MKKLVLFACCLVFAGDALAQRGFSAAPERGVHEQYVVILEEHVARRPGEDVPGQPDVPEAAEFLNRMFGGKVLHSWEHVLQGFLVQMPEATARALARHPWIASVSQDAYVDPQAALGAAVDDCYSPYQTPPGIGYWTNSRTLPWFSPQTNFSCVDPDPQTHAGCIDNWGIDRIDQTSVSRNQRYNFTDRGTGVHVYVLDTGIRADHREFQDRFGVSRVSGGYNASGGSTSDTSDCYGHGTHVAAILGGRTYGVAKDAILHPVRVIGCAGTSAPESNWITALNWIVGNHDPATQGTAIVNWSGGNVWNWVNSNSATYVNLRTAVHNLAAVPTLLLVQAAGNQSGENGVKTQFNACSYSFGNESAFVGDPKYDAIRRIFVAGGSDEDDGRWTRRPGDPYFSSYCGADCGSNIGACVDLFAPAGHVVAASWLNSAGYCRLSGTSMAAPHVAGVAANYLQRNRQKTAQQVKDRLLIEATANVLQTSSSHLNYIGAGSPNKLLDSRMPAVTCGVDRTLTTAKNTSLNFLASTLKGTGCVSNDFTYVKWNDALYGTITLGGIGPSDISYYYHPPANWTGTDTFHYVVDDFYGNVKATGMVTMTVTP